MELEYKNAIFAKDDEGVMILTDITDMPPIVRGEAVYDGKNTIVINRNNQHYFALKNIPPYIRDVLKKSDEVTVVEKKTDEDAYSYSVKVRMVDDMGIEDDWEEYSQNFLKSLKENMKPEEFEQFLTEAKEVYEVMKK